MKNFKYLQYIIKHKWFTFWECYKLGIPWLGILHDMSKFSLDEWIPYTEYFYGKQTEKLEQDFLSAWNHHQKRNKHHWQYWILQEDDGPVIYLPMPDCYRKEMLADWIGCGKALGKDDVRDWYTQNYHKIKLHKDTRRWIENQLEIVFVGY